MKQLKEAGCDIVFNEKVSGRSKDNREQFNILLKKVIAGNTIIVTKLDRFARSTKDALHTIDHLNSKGVYLIVLNMGGMPVDSSTAIGKLMITMLAGIAEFEADMYVNVRLKALQKLKLEVYIKGGRILIQRNTAACSML